MDSVRSSISGNRGRVEKVPNSPNALEDGAVGADSEKAIRSGGHVEVGLFFVGEKGVRDPDFLGHFRSDKQIRYHVQLFERQTRVIPRLPKIEIGSEVLGKGEENDFD